jgi:predicted Rossmann fold flavoprotein
VQRINTVIIGGGASGICAAISSKRTGRDVVICERLPAAGKKILASGNGRCNLLNDNLNESFYNESARGLIKAVFAKYGKKELSDFFKELGVEIYSDGGRIFPVTNQASSVLKGLELELKRLGVPVEPGFTVDNISHSSRSFSVRSKSGKTIECEKLVIAAGGKSYPALGSDGSCYKFAEKFGHKVIAPVPAGVALVVKDRLCHLLQGQRISAKAKAVINKKEVGESDGEMLFTKYGLSGTAILDISESISVAINRLGERSVYVSADMVPFMERAELEKEIEKRIKRKFAPQDILTGILPNKFSTALKEELSGRSASDIAVLLKNRVFKVDQTKGWNEAEFTAGGIDVSQVDERTLESKLVRGLYFAGEILDVCGARGGYNLAWAWASGLVAGQA